MNNTNNTGKNNVELVLKALDLAIHMGEMGLMAKIVGIDAHNEAMVLITSASCHSQVLCGVPVEGDVKDGDAVFLTFDHEGFSDLSNIIAVQG